MNILHYTLGLPPYRTGGLTKYSLDIMRCQKNLGYSVSLLYPGKFTINKKLNIKKNAKEYGLSIYEIINPLPVSLLGGINNYSAFTKSVDRKIYRDFLQRLKPDIVHIHTLMGLHKEFFEVAKELKIKIIYTTHDYFGICPKVNLMDLSDKVCNDYENGMKCISCNLNSYSMKMIYIMQSKSYRSLKDSFIVKKLRNYKKSQINNNKICISNDNKNKKNDLVDNINPDTYVNLRKYYFSMLNLVDYFHFNSNISKQEYEKYIPSIKGDVIHITHADIKQHNYMNKQYDISKGPLKITYLGPIDKYKGFYLLKDSLNCLLSNNINAWKINIYGDNRSLDLDNKYYMFKGRYLYSQLEEIFKESDVIVIPSIWKETFGFIGIEALSYGIPVIVSDTVGMKDIVEENKVGIVFKPNIENLSNVLEYIINNRGILEDLKENIINSKFDFTLDKHINDIINMYMDVIEERM